jgi:predicted alpha/beta hydrolase family esterase
LSKLIKISTIQPAEAIGDVVLVHGLEGDHHGTWQVANEQSLFWPSWLVVDIPNVNVWALDYHIKAVEWKSKTMPLPDRAINVLATLEAHAVGKRPIVFVAHSFGGLLVKQLLRSAVDLHKASWSAIAEQTKGVVFLSTPHSGSEKANWLKHMTAVLGATVTLNELKEHDPHLRNLNYWYRSNAKALGIVTEVYYEQQSTKGLLIVDETSSDPGIDQVVPMPWDADHLTICKFSTREEPLYLRLRQFIESFLTADYASAVTSGHRRLLVHIDVPLIPKVPKENGDPGLPVVLERVAELSRLAFPDGTVEFPAGSFLRLTPAAVGFVLHKPTVALRGAIEFMQAWHTLVLKGYPDLRVVIDYSTAPPETTPKAPLCAKDALLLLPPPAIYLSESVVDACDPTLATFIRHCSIGVPPKTQTVYRAEFANPRTVADSSLLHALFVARPAADEARQRLLELFIAEYVLEKGCLSSFADLRAWMEGKNYPDPPQKYLHDLVVKSEYFVEQGNPPEYVLADVVAAQIAAAREEHTLAKAACIDEITTEVLRVVQTSNAVANIDIAQLLDDYLIAVFLEVRLMANYVRRTSQLFDGTSDVLRSFDYIILSRLNGISENAAETWRTAFIRALKSVSEKGNIYIATVFHNVLATYYLNRAATMRQFQIERLAGRIVYIDTNVLYALRVEASNYHEISLYCIDKLRELGFEIKIFPFSIREYEHSLRHVEKGFSNGVADPWLVSANPWLYQEYKLRQARYFSIEACHLVHSVTKKEAFSEADYDEIDKGLAPHGITLERQWTAVPPGIVEETWRGFVGKMASNSWDLDKWWEFRHNAIAKSEQTVEHDVLFVLNVDEKAKIAPPDDFGPKVLSLTLDREHLLRLRRTFPFLIGIRQCQEFFLPYLFLSDIPLKEAVSFPNRLLGAQLGTLLVKRPLQANDAIESLLNSGSLSSPERAKRMPREIQDIATVLNSQRFSGTVGRIESLPPDEKREAVSLVASVVDELRQQTVTKAFDDRANKQEVERLKAELDDEKQRNAKLAKTNQYLKSQRGKRR